MTLRKTTSIALATILATVLMASAISGDGSRGRQSWAPSMGNQPTVAGTWLTRIRPRNCETGVPGPVSGIRGLVTFHEGGTVSEYGIGPGLTPALRSPGHGVWRRDHGWQDYAYAFTYYRYDAGGGFVGSTKVTAVLELDAGGDGFVGNSAVEIFDAEDRLVSTACATAAGSRFQ